MKTLSNGFGRICGGMLILSFAGLGGGCQVDAFLDPSKQYYAEPQPTTMPILTKLDVIERDPLTIEDFESPNPQDLLPNTLSYTFVPGDFVRVEVYELIRPREMWSQVLRVDQAGRIRLPQIGDLVVAGLTSSELEDAIREQIRSYVLNPTVSVTPEETRAFQYTIYGVEGGNRQATGLYNIVRPDFRILEALAAAGGVPRSTKYIYVIRHVRLDAGLEVTYPPISHPGPTPTTTPDGGPAVDVEDLINQLGGDKATTTKPEVDVFPGMLADEPPVDVDDLEPVRVSDRPFDRQDIKRSATPTAATRSNSSDTYIYDARQDRWIRAERPGPARTTPAPGPHQPAPHGDTPAPAADEAGPYRTRIIEIPYDRLAKGDPTLNIVVRPGDYINIQQSDTGVVYIEGEVNRPGVYQLPLNDRITLSRIIAAAGGFGPIAIPERVDLIRIVGEDREAAITLDLGAIRHRTEPDVYLKPNDHVIVGTNFWALPLAVIRNGFRATYGFGFLLDRNFGNDVFGAPPTNVQGQ